MPRPHDAITHPESLLLKRSLAPTIAALPTDQPNLARLRLLAQALGDLPSGTLIGAATLQACLQGVVEHYERTRPEALAATAPEGTGAAKVAERFLLGPFASRPLAGLLVLQALRGNPALVALVQLWTETTDDQDAALVAARARLASEMVPGLGMSLLEALEAPSRAGGDLRAQLAYVSKHFAPALPPELTLAAQLAADLLAEEQQARFGGPGPAQAPHLGGPGGLGGPFGAHGGPGPGGGDGSFGMHPDAVVDDLVGAPAAFSQDKAWMPGVVMMAKQTLVWLDQLSQRYQRPIHRLDQVPDEELDQLVGRGFNCLWLIGLWERSEASREIKRRMGNPEAEASAYALHDYVIASRLGGETAWHDLSQRAGARGLRLASDMVPNHTGIDSHWIVEHPERFLQLPQPPYPNYRFTGPDLCQHPDITVQLEDGYWDRSDAAVVFRHHDRRSGVERFIYHGNDGTQMPWNDTAQLDYLDPGVRDAVIQTILAVARRFPVIRFDAAMTLARRHVQRLWHPVPGSAGAVPSRAEHGVPGAEFQARMPVEFWREVVDRVAREVPETLLLAEAFWMMEGYFVRSLGMHRVYNSAFMHMLRDENVAGFKGLIKETLTYSPGILERYVNFVNNPDEDTAVAQFGKSDKYFGVCTVLATLPGLPMFGHGQIEGFEEKYGMEYARAYKDEQADQPFVDHHERVIFPLLRRRHLFSGVAWFSLYDVVGDGGVVDSVLAYSNRVGDERSLVLFNDRMESVSGRIHAAAPFNTADIDDAPALEMRTFCDSLGLDPRAVHAMRRLSDGHWFLRTGEELATHGLQVQLGAYEAQVYMDWRVLWGDDARTLCHRLNGGGVYDLDGALASVAAERAAPAETEDDVPVDEDADDVEVDDPEVGEE